MLTQTTILAVRALIFLARQPKGQVCSPRLIAGSINASPAYMAKVLRQLVKAGILRAEHGKNGGVYFYRPPEQVSLLAIVEASQGTVVTSYCQEDCAPESTCAFHKAAQELQGAIIRVLKKWDVKSLAKQPVSAVELQTGIPCLMSVPIGHKQGRVLGVHAKK